MRRPSDSNTIYIAVGSNIDPHVHVPEAVRRLGNRLSLGAVSTFYRTAPVGGRRQPDFRNGVLEGTSDLPPRSLKFDVLRAVERELGRARTHDKYASRTIDLDVLLYGTAVIEEPDLRVPDPDIRTRPFVAVPLMELNPDLVLPDTGEPLKGLAVLRDRAGLEVDAQLTEAVRSVLVETRK